MDVMMSDFMLALMFLAMVVSPCLVARLICTSKDRAPILRQPLGLEYWT